MRVEEGEVDGAWPLGASKGKSGVDAWGVEAGKAQVCGSVKVGGGLPFLLRGEESGRFGC